MLISYFVFAVTKNSLYRCFLTWWYCQTGSEVNTFICTPFIHALICREKAAVWHVWILITSKQIASDFFWSSGFFVVVVVLCFYFCVAVSCFANILFSAPNAHKYSPTTSNRRICQREKHLSYFLLSAFVGFDTKIATISSACGFLKWLPLLC